MRILLDTNAYSELKRGRPSLAELVRRSERIYLSMIVVGELLYGFRNGQCFDDNRKDLDAFMSNAYVTVAPVTLETADRYGLIASALRRKGTRIPSNDIWIAAHAMETGASLVTHDEHFEHVAGLALIKPAP